MILCQTRKTREHRWRTIRWYSVSAFMQIIYFSAIAVQPSAFVFYHADEGWLNKRKCHDNMLQIRELSWHSSGKRPAFVFNTAVRHHLWLRTIRTRLWHAQKAQIGYHKQKIQFLGVFFTKKCLKSIIYSKTENWCVRMYSTQLYSPNHYL